MYYVVKTLTAMVCEGSVQCLALAYVVKFSTLILSNINVKKKIFINSYGKNTTLIQFEVKNVILSEYNFFNNKKN